MSVFRKRNLLIASASLIIIASACAAIWGVPRLMKRSVSVSSQVTMYLLDDRGEVNGLLLASGDQLHFSPQTGAIVASQIKAGDQVTAIGHAGTKTNYGREIKVEQISSNGRTIVEVDAGPPHPHGPKDKPGPPDRDGRPDRKGPRDLPAQDESATRPPEGAKVGNDVNAKVTTNALPTPSPSASPTPEVFKAIGTIGTHLVNGHGDVDGLILSSGEQVRFSPKVGNLVTAAEQGASTQVSVEGDGVRNERGVVIRPTQISVGSQTIAVRR